MVFNIQIFAHQQVLASEKSTHTQVHTEALTPQRKTVYCTVADRPSTLHQYDRLILRINATV